MTKRCNVIASDIKNAAGASCPGLALRGETPRLRDRRTFGCLAMTTNILFVLFFFALLCDPLAAETIDLFSTAQAEYKGGRYQEAINLYEQMLKSGQLYAVVYYNLGNAYARVGDLGKAVLNFERARRLNPRDPEILNNLGYVNGLLEQQIADTRPAVLIGLNRILDFTSAMETELLSLLSYTLWILAYILHLLLKRPRWMKRISSVTFFVFLLSTSAAVLKHFVLREENAVVVEKTAEVKYGPSEHDKTAFKLTAGLPVFVREKRDFWSRIELRDGTGGWISNEAIEPVYQKAP
ncbi:MAG: tetratricopeptide repeat protein [Candidatus Omnitrophica bacterium]|nr:tetratricopeptide repeat protein [Candidatus Omnitrophota bacterium]